MVEPNPIETVVRGPVGDDERDAAVRKLEGAMAGTPRPVLHARLVLSREGNPAIERPAVAKAMVDVSGRPVRAHVAASTIDEATDLLADRVRRNIRRLAERREDRVHEPALTEDGQWRHGALPTPRPEYFPRPREERRVMRHKAYSVARITPEEALFEMDLMDYDFHLFTDQSSGADAVVHRRHDGEPVVLSAAPDAGRGLGGEPSDIAVMPVTDMTMDTAIETLDAGDLPFVAFLDADRRRLHVVYRRYDGHYGLITPDAVT